jgi:hypothetical protein
MWASLGLIGTREILHGSSSMHVCLARLALRELHL